MPNANLRWSTSRTSISHLDLLTRRPCNGVATNPQKLRGAAGVEEIVMI